MGVNFEQAVEDAKTAIRIDPNNYWNYDELGKIYFSNEKYDLSVQAYTSALSLESNASGYLGRGMAYHLLADYPHALADLTKADQIDRGNLDVYMERGWTNFDAKHYTDAIVDFTSALELDHQLANAHVGRGRGLSRVGKYERSVDDFTAALTIDPEFSHRLLRARLYPSTERRQ